MKQIIFSLLIASVLTLGIGCGSDTPTNTGGTGGGHPNISMKVGSTFHFDNDTISTTNGNFYRTSAVTDETIDSTGTFFDSTNSYRVYSVTRDSITHLPIKSEYLYAKYNSNTGKFYQYGALAMIDSNQAKTWDLLADFSVASGTQWFIATLNKLNGMAFLKADVNGKVAADTTLICTSGSVKCYRIELNAAIQAYGQPVGNIIIDYFIGYTPSSAPSNPSGVVAVKLRPISIAITPPITLHGLYQRLISYTY